jgi:hypothetical protein
MINATGLELRAGSRILLAEATCGCSRATGSAWSAATAPARPPRSRCSPARASRTPARSSAAGPVGYLPQDPRPAT